MDVRVPHVKTRNAMLIAAFLVPLILSFKIISDSGPSHSFISFMGKSEIALLAVSPNESQYNWSISGAYICFDPDVPPKDKALFASAAPQSSALCGGPHGKSNRKLVQLPDDTSLAFVGDTTLEIAVEPPPLHADPNMFASGRVPNGIMIIKTVVPLDQCSRSANSAPILHGSGLEAELWDEAEIHVPLNETTLMPFAGRIRLGQPASANTSNQLKEGTIAVYRKAVAVEFLKRQYAANRPSQISDTSLFPGDVVKFQAKDGCLAEVSGFLATRQEGDIGYLQVVVSMLSSDGQALIERPLPGSTANSDDIVVEAQMVDAILTHPYTVWVGLMISFILIFKEVTDLFLE